MNLEKFQKHFTRMISFLSVIGFPKDDDSIETRTYARLLSYSGDISIINSRIMDEIAENDHFNELMRNCASGKNRLFSSRLRKSLENNMKLIIDVQDFYFYTRRFLDSLNLVMRHFFINIGRTPKMTYHSSDLLKKQKMEYYKKEIDFGFFEGLQNYTFLIADIKKSRDGLMHHNDYLGFTSTKKGTLGFEILDISKTEWGTETVKDLAEEIQKTIDNLSNLVEYTYNYLQSIWDKNNLSQNGC